MTTRGTRFTAIDAAPGARHLAGWQRAGDADSRTALLGDYTIEAIIWLDALPSNIVTIIDYSLGDVDDLARNTLISFQILTTGMIRTFWEYGAGTNQTLSQSAGDAVPTGRKVHVAIVATIAAGTRTVKVWIDGTLQETLATANEAAGGTSSEWHFGTRGDPMGFQSFADIIYQVKLSTVAVADATLEANAGALELSLDAGTFALWGCDAADTTDPVIELVSPAAGTDLAEAGFVTLRAYDVGDGLELVALWAVFSDEIDPVPIYLRSAFQGRFASRSSISGSGTLADPYLLVLAPSEMWERKTTARTVQLEADVIDAAGNLVALTVA